MNASDRDREERNQMLVRMNRRTFLTGVSATAAAVAGAGLQGTLAGGSAGRPARVARYQDQPVEIEFLHIWGTPPGEQEATDKHPAEQLIDAFNDLDTGVTVISRTPSGIYFEVLQQAQAQMAAGNSPALVITPWSNINFAVEGLDAVSLEEIGGEDQDQVLGNLKPQVIDLVRLDDRTVGLPFAFSCPVIYYNNDIFTAAGVDPQEMFESWDSFAELGPRIMEETGTPILGVGVNEDWPAQSLIQSNGGRVLNDDDEPVMDSPESVEAMQMMADLDTLGLLDQSMQAERRATFVAGTSACFMTSIAALGGLRRDVSFDLQTTPFPVFTGKPRRMASGGSFIGCYARDEEQQQAAWEFLRFAVSEEGTEIWMRTGYLNATNFEVEVLPGQESANIQLEEGLTRETAWPGPRAAEIQRVWETYVERIWANQISAEEGCAQAVAEITSLI